jgi:hypothetical protein
VGFLLELLLPPLLLGGRLPSPLAVVRALANPLLLLGLALGCLMAWMRNR